MSTTSTPTPMEVTSEDTFPVPTPTTTIAPPNENATRKTNKWIQHVKSYRLENAEKIKTDKLSCGAISKLARGTYTPRTKCTECGK